MNIIKSSRELCSILSLNFEVELKIRDQIFYLKHKKDDDGNPKWYVNDEIYNGHALQLSSEIFEDINSVEVVSTVNTYNIGKVKKKEIITTKEYYIVIPNIKTMVISIVQHEDSNSISDRAKIDKYMISDYPLYTYHVIEKHEKLFEKVTIE